MKSTSRRLILPLSTFVFFAGSGVAWAGTITAQGNVTALTNVNELQGIVGTADFNVGPNNASMSLTQYTAQGATWHTGTLSSILPGVSEPGSASTPIYQNNFANFPAPIAGGGTAEGFYTYFGGAVTFSDPVTQVGLTASKNGTQYLTVWDTNGTMIGQVTWQPSNDAAFIGLDTNGVPIGMVTYGNDNMWGGGTYNIGGSTIMADTWIWALGTPCQSAADCPDDMNPCTVTACTAGACNYPADPQGVCPDDGNSCTNDVCQNGACVHPNNTDPCDDMDACTDMDTCSAGECVGSDIACNDMNICSQDSCDSQMGCVFDFAPGCCTSDADCEPGEICLLGSNSCIPDPNPDSDTTTDTTDTTTDTTDTTTDTTDTTTDTTDTTGDTGGDTGGDTTTTGGNEDDVGDTFGGPLDTFGFDDGVQEEGCNCSSDQRGGGALFGLLGLALLGTFRRRRE